MSSFIMQFSRKENTDQTSLSNIKTSSKLIISTALDLDPTFPKVFMTIWKIGNEFVHYAIFS